MGSARIRRILYATDFSAASGRAFGEALALARQHRAALRILHVLTPPSPFVNGTPPRHWLELMARARNAAERKLSRLLSSADQAGVGASGALADDEYPAQAIAREARRERADVIVIGTHGRSGLGRLFMGSVATRVLQTAPCPVLTVRSRRRPR